MPKVDKLVDEALTEAAIRNALKERNKVQLTIVQKFGAGFIGLVLIGDFVLSILHYVNHG